MYKFNYQFLASAEAPIFTCIVPTEWLAKNLPIMGGDVAYVDSLNQQTMLTDYIFEFSEVDAEKQYRTIILNVRHKKWAAESGRANIHTNLLAAPVTIHCRVGVEREENADVGCVELLLNHLFGSCALSASVGNQYLDFADVFTVLQMSSEFDFEFGIGDTPTDIIPGILQRVTLAGYNKSVFLMLFGRAGKVRVTHLDEAMQVFSSDDVTLLMSDVAVDQDKMLLSVLIGR